MSDGIRMGNGPEIMVPFDLKRDVVDRLASLEDAVRATDAKVTQHIEDHRREVEERARRIEKTKQLITWVGGLAGGIASAWAAWTGLGR